MSNFKKVCIVCGNPVYDGRMWYCSMKCKKIWKRKRNKQPKYYYDTETQQWETLEGKMSSETDENSC